MRRDDSKRLAGSFMSCCPVVPAVVRWLGIYPDEKQTGHLFTGLLSASYSTLSLDESRIPRFLPIRLLPIGHLPSDFHLSGFCLSRLLPIGHSPIKTFAYHKGSAHLTIPWANSHREWLQGMASGNDLGEGIFFHSLPLGKEIQLRNHSGNLLESG